MLVNQGTDVSLNDEFMDQNGIVLNPLYLFRDPVQLLEASTKQYIDNKLQSLNASNITEGIISSSRFPAFNGEISNSPGSSTLVLSTTGVTLGDYAKVTVNAKGRVSNGLSLTNDDIPDLDWSKITSGKPSSLDGYGITDGVKVSGSSMTGYLSTQQEPVNATDLINRAYLSNAATAASYETGDVISKVSETVPNGFLACRGGKVSSTLYPELSNLLGDTYSTDMYIGAGRPWEQQYGINFEPNARLLNWTTAGTMVGAAVELAVFVTKNRVYACGGYNGTSRVATCHYAHINEDGTLSNWISGPGLPGNVGNGSVVMTKNRVFIIGGYTSTGHTVGTQVYTSIINLDGSIGTWSTSVSLPTALSHVSTIVIKDRIYAIGGYNGLAAVNTIYSIQINNDGTLGTWKTENPFPITNHTGQFAVIKNKLYSFGGYSNDGDLVHNYVYVCNINSDGTLGSWIKEISLPTVIDVHITYVINNRVFIIGGKNTTTVLSSIYWSDINLDGTLKGWIQDQFLLAPLCKSALVTVNNRIYLLGGLTTSEAITSTIYTCEVQGGSNDYSQYYTIPQEETDLYIGGGRPWEQQYEINNEENITLTNWANETPFPITNRHSVLCMTKNRVYMLSGYNGSYHQEIYSAIIDQDGNLGTWENVGNMPEKLTNISGVIVNNRLHILGGTNYSVNNDNLTVYSNKINNDGTLGAWISNSTLPGPSKNSTCFITKKYLYVFAGYTISAPVNTMYMAPIMPNGELGVWTTAPSFPVPMSQCSVGIIKNYVYIFGGMGGSPYNTIYRTIINADGTISSWQLYGILPFTFTTGQIYVTKSKVFLIGGMINSVPSNIIYASDININGDLNTFSSFSTFPIACAIENVCVTSTKMYIIGGWDGSNYLSNIQSADISGGISDTTQYCLLEDTNNYLMPGSGAPWEQQYQINLTQNANLTGWSLAGNFPNKISTNMVLVTKNRVYVLGGWDGTAHSVNIYTTTINTNGTIGSWTISGTLPTVLHYATMIVIKNRVYLFSGTDAVTYFKTVYVANINSDGTLGSFSLSTPLPTIAYFGATFVTSNRVYIIGGYNGSTATSIIYTAMIYSDGTLGPWETAENFLTNIYGSQVVVTKNRVYLIGGRPSTGTMTDKIYTAPISSSGIIGRFSEIGSYPNQTTLAGVFVTNNKLYIIGGFNNLIPTMSVYYANINADGTLDTWVAGDNIPAALSYLKTFATKNTLYLFGGYNGSAYVNTIYQVSIAEGLNDYSSYYNGTILPLADMEPEYFFGLPDETILNDNYHTDLHYFIKY